MKPPARHSVQHPLPSRPSGVLVCLAPGYSYCQRQKNELTRSTEDQRSASADLKVAQVTRWRMERMNDALLIQNDEAVVGAAKDILEHPESEEPRERLLRLFNTRKRFNRYNRITFLNTRMEVVLSTPPSENGPTPDTRGLAYTALNENRVIISDLHRDTKPERVSMELCIPLRSTRSNTEFLSQDVGVLVVEIDPFEFIFPHIQSWPTPSESAETLLVRRDREDVLFLNQLRHRPNTALLLRFNAAKNPSLLATHAILGHRRLIEAIDYRGVPTIGVGRKIPDSPWYLVAKVDRDEIFAPLSVWLKIISLSSAVLIIGVSFGIAFAWQKREVHFARKELEEREKTAAALKRSFSLLEATLESTADGILVVDHSGRITNYNERFAKLWRLPNFLLDEGENKKALDFVVSQLREPEAFISKIAQLEEQPEANSFDVVDFIDGRRFERYSHPQFIDGIPVGRVWSFRDVTERRNAELERERLTTALERKNQELENLIYAASHDLRSPLVNIEGFSRRVEKACQELRSLATQIESSDQRFEQINNLVGKQIPKSLSFIRSGVAKMNTLINGLLQLSRLGQAAMKIEDLDMNKLMAQICTTMAYQLQQAGAAVKIHTLPSAHGDAQLVNQVFSNLIDNAIKYRDPARPLIIQISGSEHEKETLFCVEDNGIGIAPDHQAKIWEMFHRLNPKGSTEGEGIGLNIVKSIMDKHHGHIRLDSVPDRGSRFHVVLPRPVISL